MDEISIQTFFKFKKINAPINVNPVAGGEGGSAGKGQGFDA